MTKRMWYFIITLVFALEVGVLATHIDTLHAAPLTFWVLLAPATLAGARTISFYGVSDWWRHHFVVEVADSSGAGNNLEARPGKWEAIGELICCPICSGTHVASLLLCLYAIAPNAGHALVYVLGIAGTHTTIHWWTEAQEWKGRAAREQAGTQWLTKNTPLITAKMVDQKHAITQSPKFR